MAIETITIIGSLLYLEIIELNFCKINYYLKENIINRGKKEVNENIYDYEDYEEDTSSNLTK